DRLNELPDEEHAVIEWLSVAGGPLSEDDIDALSGAATADSIARLCARGLCDLKTELVDVRHPLTRDVAYRALDRRRRVKMHKRLGQHLAKTPLARGLTAAVVARHFARGNEKSEAANYYLEAANAARAGYQ